MKGILDELSSATGDPRSNEELVARCLKTPALLHSIAEGLRMRNLQTQLDCASILVAVAEKNAAFVGGLVNDLLDASRSNQSKLAVLGFKGLSLVIDAAPTEIFAQRDYLIETARSGGTKGLHAFKTLAALCKHNANYRGKIVGSLSRIFDTVSVDDVPKWFTAAIPAIDGSRDAIKRLAKGLEPHLGKLPPDKREKLEQKLKNLERKAK